MTGIYAAGPNGEHLGPYTADDLCDEIIAGRMPESVLVWWEGASGWVPLHTEQSLAAHLTERRSAPPKPLTPVEPPRAAPAPQPAAPAPAPAPAPQPVAAAPAPAPAPAQAPAPAAAPAPRTEPVSMPEPVHLNAPAPLASVAEAQPVEATEPEAPQSAVLMPAPPDNDEELDEIFARLVTASWEYHRQVDKANRTDEVVLGALIASTLDNGFVLTDLTSDGTSHYTRFEDPTTRARVTLALTHLTGDLLSTKVLGQRASVVVGYGEPVQEFQRIWQEMKAEVKTGYLGTAEPGTVTVDADVAAGYLYVQVDLYLDLSGYLDDELNVNYESMTMHLSAVVNALRKTLYARIYG